MLSWPARTPAQPQSDGFRLNSRMMQAMLVAGLVGSTWMSLLRWHPKPSGVQCASGAGRCGQCGSRRRRQKQENDSNLVCHGVLLTFTCSP